MKNWFGLALLYLVAVSPMLFPIALYCQEVGPDLGSMAGDLIKAIGDLKSIGWQAGVIGILTVVISTTKNSLLKTYVWDKLGSAKVLVAPALAMVIVMLTVHPFNLKAVILALTTGMGAIALHQLLDALKSAPFIGEPVKKVIDVIGKFLGRDVEADKAKEAAVKAALEGQK